ncbi:HAD family hydrolase [Streptomyces sp. NPDC057555]|uniref:HAD family hydrolase n=1 Tax=Streptomyces sp. NPDC057555 TaxID=3346166 RepID=UPI0036A4D79C
MTAHIVWDWNGTLLDDFEISVEAASVACLKVGGSPVGHDDYRRCFTRPVRAFYERLLGGVLSDEQWHTIVETYHDSYRRSLPRARLRPRTAELLAELSESGVTHSLLSMGEHEEVTEVVARLGIAESFLAIEGMHRRVRTETKRQALERHLARLGGVRAQPVRVERVVMIGDTLDDSEAASAAGVACVLLGDGSFDRSAAERLGLAVAPGIAAAVERGLRMIADR